MSDEVPWISNDDDALALLSELYGGGWVLESVMENPWGVIPMTGGGQSLPARAREYFDRLLAQQAAPDPTGRRHHFVPQSYLREWSFDGRRIWALDTVTGSVRALGLRHVCVHENFHRVVGPDGEEHNRVESMFGVVDAEMRRLQQMFNTLEDPDHLVFDDLIGLSASVALQWMRTTQKRRLLQQRDQWFAAQGFDQSEESRTFLQDSRNLAGYHTETIFKGMWKTADLLSTRQIEIWDDPKGRFMTSDSPVVVPFRRNVRPSLNNSTYVLWPVSPRRVVALNNHLAGEKALILSATGKHVGMVREGVYQGRERMIFASEAQKDSLPTQKKFRRRTQSMFRCSDRGPDGRPVQPPYECCIEMCECFATGPVVQLCDSGLHQDAPAMQDYT